MAFRGFSGWKFYKFLWNFVYNSKNSKIQNFKNIQTYLIPLILWLLLFTDGIKVVSRPAIRSSIRPQSSLESSLCRVFIRMFSWHSKMCCITTEGIYKVTPFFYLDFLHQKFPSPSPLDILPNSHNITGQNV